MFSFKKILVKFITNDFTSFIRRRAHHFRKRDLLSKISRLVYIISLKILYSKNKDFLKDTMNVNLFTVAWGNYINLFLRYSLPSLLQDDNLVWVKNNYNVKIDFYTDKNYLWFKENYPEMISIFDEYNFEFKNVNEFLNKGERLSPNVYINCYKDQIKKSINNNTTCMPINPDMVYANASLKNIMLINRGKNFCYSYIHPRVNMKDSMTLLEKFRDDKGVISIDSKKLVRLAMENLHHNDKFANDELDINITTRGKSWRKIDEKTFIVVNTSINPQIYNFIPKDLKYINNLTKLSEFDRELPNYFLGESRLRFITSSDIYFAIELTDEEENKVDPVSNKYNDQPEIPSSHGEFAGSAALLTWTMD